MAFCILYYGTTAVIGLAAPGGYYIGFVHDYFDYPALLRKSLLNSSQLFLSAIGYHSNVIDISHLKIENGPGIQLVYSCLGYGLMSFWAAFIFANSGTVKRKITWIITGCLMLWLINVLRISLLLIAFDKHWSIPFNIDHHTLFNVVAYTFIFGMIWFFERQQRKSGTALYSSKTKMVA